MSLLAIAAGLATGLMLGLFGSGGSIITLPALMYLLGVEAKPAIAMSLGIVAITASISAVTHWRRGNVNVPVAAIFGLFGVAGTYGGARLGVMTPELVQLLLFAAIMYAAAWRMTRPGAVVPRTDTLVRLDCSGAATMLCFDASRVGQVAAHGIVVGVVTGMVGVGGGFLIVPALVLLSGLPMKQAVGTSLVIVSAKSAAGFAGYLGAVAIDYALMGTFTAIAVVGSILGAAASRRMSADGLKTGFAVFLAVVASYIVYRETIGG
ncbi:sulfite exporter TauE/SafE family protein [Magnetospirillum sp. UT-4]|uniref:sulfite exporter TauE/SafE family protein n=1 Tax=Magnetospirillum sp. UT-4 TaxID=2681467 RepID=UPI00137D4580|nr:sulfite exporter TauE/SafE family protein [Magnetospirillum sp. UT-4]CAA7614371.1 putative sulfite/sulfoacetate exporter of taurine metabolism [Magnetospirillum sp. UT-4]